MLEGTKVEKNFSYKRLRLKGRTDWGEGIVGCVAMLVLKKTWQNKVAVLIPTEGGIVQTPCLTTISGGVVR